MKTPYAYKDVQDVLDTALAANGGTYTLPTRGKAIQWRQRAYAFRQLKIKEAADQAASLGYMPSTNYDNLVLQLDGNKVRISRRVVEGQLELNDPDAPPPSLPTGPTDDLLLEALRLAETKGEEDGTD